jgi:hypothetical protein
MYIYIIYYILYIIYVYIMHIYREREMSNVGTSIHVYDYIIYSFINVVVAHTYYTCRKHFLVLPKNTPGLLVHF